MKTQSFIITTYIFLLTTTVTMSSRAQESESAYIPSPFHGGAIIKNAGQVINEAREASEITSYYIEGTQANAALTNEHEIVYVLKNDEEIYGNKS